MNSNENQPTLPVNPKPSAPLAHPNVDDQTRGPDKERRWVDCPICNEPDMRAERDDDGWIIHCVNLACASNRISSSVPPASKAEAANTIGYPAVCTTCWRVQMDADECAHCHRRTVQSVIFDNWKPDAPSDRVEPVLQNALRWLLGAEHQSRTCNSTLR